MRAAAPVWSRWTLPLPGPGTRNRLEGKEAGTDEGDLVAPRRRLTGTAALHAARSGTFARAGRRATAQAPGGCCRDRLVLRRTVWRRCCLNRQPSRKRSRKGQRTGDFARKGTVGCSRFRALVGGTTLEAPRLSRAGCGANGGVEPARPCPARRWEVGRRAGVPRRRRALLTLMPSMLAGGTERAPPACLQGEAALTRRLPCGSRAAGCRACGPCRPGCRRCPSRGTPRPRSAARRAAGRCA